MRCGAAAIVLCLAPATASAGPLTVGVDLGVADDTPVIGVFGRLGASSWIAGQLELAHVVTDDPRVELRVATAAVVVDLGARGPLVPTLIVALGFDTESALRFEGGLGLEYRATSGVTIGADVRLGDRRFPDDAMPLTRGAPAAGISYCEWSGECVEPTPATEPEPRGGTYRSTRITLAVRF